MNMHTFDEADFRTLFGFSHETYNEYSGIYSRLRENVNASTKKITAYKPSKKNFKNTLIMPTPKKKLSCREGLTFQNKSFREDIIEPNRISRLKEMHQENLLLSSRSRGVVAVQRKISNLSQRHLSLNRSFKNENDENILEENQNVFGENLILPVNTMFRDLDEMTEYNQIEENYRMLLRKTKKVYDSLSDEELSDEEINEAYYVEPFSNLRLGYDLLLFVLVFYSMFSVPYQLAFYFIQSDLNGYGFLINVIIDLVFIFDIILSFFTAYYDFEEKLVKFYDLMALHYFQTWFIVDFFSGIPVNSILNLIIMKYPNCEYALSTRIFYQGNLTVLISVLKLLRLVKAMKVFSTNSFLDKLTTIKQTVFVAKTIRLLTTLLIFAMFMHLFSCVVIFLGYNNYPNWIANINLEPKDNVKIYIASLYFICTTVISVGYGDILTYNTTERLINCFLLVVGLLLYSWTLSSLSSYLISDDKIIVEYRNKCDILEDIKVSYDLPNELYSKLQRHLLYKLTSQKMDVNDIFNSLPIGLRNTLIIEMYKPIVKNFFFFKSFNSTDFIIQVVMSFKPLLSLKGEKLLNDGDVLDEMIFVKKGKLVLEFPLPLVLNDGMGPGAGAQTLGGATFYESCGNKLTYAFQTMAGFKGNLPWLRKSDTKHFELSDFDFKKTMRRKREQSNNDKKDKDKPVQQYVKLIEIRKNEHFGDVLMFLTKRSPLRVRVKSKKAELYLLKKTDAVEISNSFPKIWKQIIKKSLFNMKQINRLINKSLKFFFIHYEGTKNILGKSLMPFNPNQTVAGGVPHDTVISHKNKFGMLAKMTLGQTLDKAQINALRDIKEQVAADIDTSHSELESIPDDDDDDDDNEESKDKKNKSGDEEDNKAKKKLKITRILETFEEDALKQSLQKIKKQTIIYQHYDELLKLNKEKSSDEEDETSKKGKRKKKKSGNINNIFLKAPSKVKRKKSSSSSSGSSIIDNTNINNNPPKENSSSLSSSFDNDNENKSSKTNSNIMNKSKLNRSNINKSTINDSYKDLKLKQHPPNILDEIIDKNISNISNQNVNNNNNNSLRLLNDSDESEGNVYSEFHSNEGDLKDNLFMKRPILEGYDPFSNYSNSNFNKNSNGDEQDGIYENLFQNFNNKPTFVENPTIKRSNNDLISNNTNNVSMSLSRISTILTQKPKSHFGGSLSSINVSKTETKQDSVLQPTKTVSGITYKGTNKPKCNFTFSKYNNPINTNKTIVPKNKNPNMLDEGNDSSFSSSSVDTQKKTLIKKTLKTSVTVSPGKQPQNSPKTKDTLIKKKQAFANGINASKVMTSKTLINLNHISTTEDNRKGTNIMLDNNKDMLIKNNRLKEIKRTKTKRLSSKVNSLFAKGVEETASLKKSTTLMLNQSDSSSSKEKGQEDLEVEKIMSMTPNLTSDKKRGNLFRQILTPGSYASKHTSEITGNEGYKKSFFGLSPTLKKRQLVKTGTSKENALDRITSNIQENSTNLNEPKEFYSNLFSQFLDEKKEEEEKHQQGKDKNAQPNEQKKIAEDNEDFDQTIINVLNKNATNINLNANSTNNNVQQGLKRNKSLLI